MAACRRSRGCRSPAAKKEPAKEAAGCRDDERDEGKRKRKFPYRKTAEIEVDIAEARQPFTGT